MTKAHLMDAIMFKQYLIDKGMLKDSSIYNYWITTEHFLKGNPDIDNIDDYNKFLIENTIKKRNYHYYAIIKQFIEWKIGDVKIRNEILENLVRPIVKHNIKRERKYLTEEQIYNVINCLKSEKHQLLAWIQNETGVRAGDILRLQKGQITNEVYNDLPVLSLRITGKRDKRIVATIFNQDLQNTLLDYINTHNNHEMFYFLELGKLVGRQGDPNNYLYLERMNYRWYWFDVKQACKTNGMEHEDFATHDYRRCFARRVWEMTKDLVTLQRILNHSQVQTTIRYLEQSGLNNIDIYKKMQKQ